MKEYFIRYLQRSINLVGLFEFGVGGYAGCRFDLIILHAHQQRFRGFEFKRTRQDFLNDIQSGKWIKYLDYCNTFTWVCPYGLIQPEEIISPAGLLWIGKENIQECYDTTYHFFDSKWKKIPKGLEVSQEKFNKLVCLFIERIKFRKRDFF